MLYKAIEVALYIDISKVRVDMSGSYLCYGRLFNSLRKLKRLVESENILYKVDPVDLHPDPDLQKN